MSRTLLIQRKEATQGPSRQPPGTLQRLSHRCIIYHESIRQRTRKLQRCPSYFRRCWLDESLRRRNGQNTITWMLGGPTTIISPSKRVSHEKSMDIQIQEQPSGRSQISQPSIKISSRRLFSSLRSTILWELRSSSFLHHKTSIFCAYKYSQLQSAAIWRICRFHSKQTWLEPSTCLLWMRWRTRRSTQIRSSPSLSFLRYERQSSRMGLALRKRLHRLRANTP